MSTNQPEQTLDERADDFTCNFDLKWRILNVILAIFSIHTLGKLIKITLNLRSIIYLHRNNRKNFFLSVKIMRYDQRFNSELNVL